MIASDFAVTPPRRLPVTIITGYLGSGKTTLANQILANYHGARIGVIVNDLSDVNIDAELIVRTDATMVELTNGCICCSLNGDLIDAVFRLIGQDRAPDYLVVETTGVGDPLPLALTFLRSELRDRVRLDSIVTVTDAENFAPAGFEGQAVRNQLAYADIILLNKCDRVENAHLDVIQQSIATVAPHARIIRTVHCRFRFRSSSASVCLRRSVFFRATRSIRELKRGMLADIWSAMGLRHSRFAPIGRLGCTNSKNFWKRFRTMSTAARG
jgi:G3E family GTPase